MVLRQLLHFMFQKFRGDDFVIWGSLFSAAVTSICVGEIKLQSVLVLHAGLLLSWSWELCDGKLQLHQECLQYNFTLLTAVATNMMSP